MTTETTATARNHSEAASSPANSTARRFASYVGYAGSGFSWGAAKYLRRSDVIEVMPDDYKLKTRLADMSMERKDWSEVDAAYVLSELVYCAYCNTYRSPAQVEDHRKTVHERLLGGQPRAELTALQSKIVKIDADIKQLRKDKDGLTAQAAERVNTLRELGLWDDKKDKI